METVKVDTYYKIPNGFTGIAEYPDGTKFWYLDGKHHRTDGPAVEGSDGAKYWFLNGKHHRTDGPAIEWADCGKQWWLNGKQVYSFNPIGEYVVVEEGLPSDMEWLGEKVPTLKVLTCEGFKYIPKLPGI